MKLQVTQENLAKALGSVARVANTRGTLPVLANVLISTKDNRLSIAATNLDIAITHYIGSKVATPGAITVPARLTQDYINSLPSGVVNLDLEDHKLHIQSADYKSTINGIMADEFPVMPGITKGSSWRIPAKDFKRALQQVVFAASSDETRPVLTAVYLHTSEGKLYIASTDSYRLAEKQISGIREEISLLVPASAMQDVLRIIGDFDGEIEITHDEQQVLFSIGDIELVTRLIDGNYPDYRKLIPQKFSTIAKISKEEFTSITKISSLFARESAGSITIKIDEDDQTISIKSVASQLGENTSTAKADINGSGEVTLNSRFLLDGLAAFSGGEVAFSFNGKLEPCVLSDTSDASYTHVVMPLKS